MWTYMIKKYLFVLLTKNKKIHPGDLVIQDNTRLLPCINTSVPVAVQSDSQGQSRTLSHRPSNVG